MSVRPALVGFVVLAIAFMAIGQGCAPDERIVEVPGPTVTVTETVTETVTVKEPAEMPEVCLQAVAAIDVFQSHADTIDGEAGAIKLAAGNLQQKAAFADIAGMTPIIEAMNTDVRELDDASISVTEQADHIAALAVECSEAIATP